MLDFEYKEDQEYFRKLLDAVGGLDASSELFDFRSLSEKRKEFNKMRDSVFERLISTYGDSCQLRYHNDCSEKATQVDHLIPLATNVLNKQLRLRKGENGRKVPAQSFGSNHMSNFVLACKRCNAYKKHNLPSADMLLDIQNIREEEKS